MNEYDGITLAQLPTLIDHFLTAALHLGVLALYRGEIQVRATRTRRHRGGCPAAQSDQHRRAAENDELGAYGNLPLVDMGLADITEAAGDHDRLMVATQLIAVAAIDTLFIGAEIATQIRTAELIVKRRRAHGAFDHDVQSRGDMRRATEVLFLPRLWQARDAQVGDTESGEAGLRLRATPGRAFVAYLAATARGSAWKWGDGRRVVVGLHLHQNVNRLQRVTVLLSFRVRKETPRYAAGHHRCVVAIG